MTEIPKSNAKAFLDVAYRSAVLLGIIATLWLNQHYATKEEYASLEERTRKVEDLMIQMRTEQKIADRQEIVLADHEQRIRKLEEARR